MNLASVAVDGNAGATDFQARRIRCRSEEGDYLICVNLRLSAVRLSPCSLCLCGEICIL